MVWEMRSLSPEDTAKSIFTFPVGPNDCPDRYNRLRASLSIQARLSHVHQSLTASVLVDIFSLCYPIGSALSLEINEELHQPAGKQAPKSVLLSLRVASPIYEHDNQVAAFSLNYSFWTQPRLQALCPIPYLTYSCWPCRPHLVC